MLLRRFDAASFTPAHVTASGQGGATPEVAATVAAIVDEVRSEGDAALVRLTERFDRVRLTPAGLEVGSDERASIVAGVDAETLGLLERAAERIRRFHEPQRGRSFELIDDDGVRLAQRRQPLHAVGLYVPGGTACYPSSVLMNAIPAQVAGVREIVMVTPTPDGRLDPVVVAAADVAGVDRIFRIGGAQAVAALAYGTQTVPRVDKIVGPGNIWVATAKRQVYGAVDIDSIAGPSEVLIVADETADPELVAADMLAQAEHDPDATAGVVTTWPGLIEPLEAALQRRLEALARADIARRSLQGQGYVVQAPDLDAALAVADRVAAEHLELMVRDARAAAEKVRHAGAIFVGPWTPEAVGDYVAGPNHVLPTSGTARFFSGLGVADFEKRVNVLEFTPAGLGTVGDDTVTFARLEGLDAHAESVRTRLDRLSGED